MARLLLLFVSLLLGVEARADATRLRFTGPVGLTEAGKVVVAWVRAARFHGLDLAPDPAVEAWLANPSGQTPSDVVERTLEAQLARLIAELPARPRTVPVLRSPDTRFYPTPDIQWRGVPAPTASPDALAAALQSATDGNLEAQLSALVPPHLQYRRLVEAGVAYDAMCKAGGFPAVARPVVKRPKPGRAKFTTPKDDYARALRARLSAEGYLARDPDGAEVAEPWDEAAQAAFSRWLTSRQLPQPGGLLMDDLHAALDVSCEQLVATLALNAKRWRFSAWRGEPTFVEVNIAAQELRYVRDAALVMTQRTIVGANKWYFDTDLKRRLNVHATPVLTDHIARIIVNPIWAVPPRIAQNEIDKEVAKDPTYLEKKRIQLVTSARGRTSIQSPGADNALGVIKILFPNDEDVYLHDTPKKGAFKLAVRALSHGCVRVQNALDFGLQLLVDDAAKAGRPFDAEALRSRAGRGGSIIFDLATEVPVFLEYYTASVDDAGLVRFHPDVYAYDVDPAAGRR
ncbi:MAG: L,D-transpeptidase family protein [Deltaproteobacteria bacterium]|nr:L,D-transpeptidase family protein [Deltaproteobacteria bacterium]